MTVSPKLPRHATEYDDKLSYSMDAMLEVPKNNPKLYDISSRTFLKFQLLILYKRLNRLSIASNISSITTLSIYGSFFYLFFIKNFTSAKCVGKTTKHE